MTGPGLTGEGRKPLSLFSAVREIAEGADLIYVDGTAYIVAPVSASCIDALAAFEAGTEDMEPDNDDEPSIGTYMDLEGAP